MTCTSELIEDPRLALRIFPERTCCSDCLHELCHIEQRSHGTMVAEDLPKMFFLRCEAEVSDEDL